MEIWKETALRFFFIDILAFKWANYAWWILFRFLDPGAWVLHWKTVPGAGILTEKISGLGVSPGGGGGWEPVKLIPA